jgi:hypothetical protein
MLQAKPGGCAMTAQYVAPLSAMLRNERDEAHDLAGSLNRRDFRDDTAYVEACHEFTAFADLMDRAARQMDEMRELLREAPPPFGQTEERRMAWVERRDAVVNQQQE